MKFDDTPSREEREDFWTALPMASKGPKARKTSWPRPTTTRTANRCRICRPS